MTSTPSRKNSASTFWNLLKIALALGLMVYVLSRAEISSLISTLKNASGNWLLISAFLYCLLTFIKAFQYLVLMRGKLTYPQVLHLTVWQNAISNFFLAGAGIATYITMTRLAHEIKVSRSVTIFLLTKIGDLIAIWVALVCSSALVWPAIDPLQIPVLILIAGVGVALLLLLLTIFFRQRFISLFTAVLKWLRLSRFKLVETGLSYLQGLVSLEQSRVLYILVQLILYSFLYLAVTIACTYTNLAIFRIRPDIPAVIFVSILIQLVSYFPVSVLGGLGVTESSALYFWSFFAVPQDLLAPALIGIRVVFYLFNLIPLIYLPVYSVFFRQHEPIQNEQ